MRHDPLDRLDQMPRPRLTHAYILRSFAWAGMAGIAWGFVAAQAEPLVLMVGALLSGLIIMGLRLFVLRR